MEAIGSADFHAVGERTSIPNSSSGDNSQIDVPAGSSKMGAIKRELPGAGAHYP
jgi:hypothetical protein